MVWCRIAGKFSPAMEKYSNKVFTCGIRNVGLSLMYWIFFSLTISYRLTWYRPRSAKLFALCETRTDFFFRIEVLEKRTMRFERIGMLDCLGAAVKMQSDFSLKSYMVNPGDLRSSHIVFNALKRWERWYRRELPTVVLTDYNMNEWNILLMSDRSTRIVSIGIVRLSRIEISSK